jgi:hypothetical protein
MTHPAWKALDLTTQDKLNNINAEFCKLMKSNAGHGVGKDRGKPSSQSATARTDIMNLLLKNQFTELDHFYL